MFFALGMLLNYLINSRTFDYGHSLCGNPKKLSRMSETALRWDPRLNPNFWLQLTVNCMIVALFHDFGTSTQGNLLRWRSFAGIILQKPLTMSLGFFLVIRLKQI